MTITTRLAALDDLDSIGEMWSALVVHHHALDPRLPISAPDGAMRYVQRLIGLLSDRDAHILVAEDDDGVLVGYVIGIITNMMAETFEFLTSGFIVDIYVASNVRRQGVGRALVDSLMAWFRDRDIDTIEWHVAALNQDAKQFWQSFGARELIVRMRTTLSDAPSSTNEVIG